MNHGTYSAYTSGGCRCDDCRQAARDHKRRKYGDTVRLPWEPMFEKFSEFEAFSLRYSAFFPSWKRYGIDPYKADTVCCDMGVHPYEIWGDEWFVTEWRKDEASPC